MQLSRVRPSLQHLFDNIEKPFINRTGAALAKGDVVAVDLLDEATETEPFISFDPSTDADTIHPFASVVPVTTAHLKGFVFAVALESIADNAVGRFGIQGVFQVSVAGSSAVDKGDQIMPANGVTTVTKLTDGLVCLGQALEVGPTGAAAAKWCVFDGVALFASGAASV